MLSQLIKEYLNFLLKDYQQKGIEKLSMLSGKILYIFIITVTALLTLQLAGLALVLFIGSITGNILWGFGVVILLFLALMLLIYLLRDKLFFHKFVAWYRKFFLT